MHLQTEILLQEGFMLFHKEMKHLQEVILHFCYQLKMLVLRTFLISVSDKEIYLNLAVLSTYFCEGKKKKSDEKKNKVYKKRVMAK